ncbi:MAG: hypothetical protein RSC92_04740, partial [Clostridia bacterium]
IANSISIFFTTLVDLFNNKNVIPDEAKMNQINNILLGTKSDTLFGKVTGKRNPSILDSITKFAEVIKTFAGITGELNVDIKGKATSVKMNDIVKNITNSLTLFFDGLVAGVSKFGSEDNLKSITNVSEILLGAETTKKFGWGLWSSNKKQPGILEPVIKFAEMLKLFSSGKDENGNDLNFDASNIVNKILSFSNDLTTSLTSKSNVDKLNDLSGDIQKSPLEKFNNLIDGLNGNVDKIEIVANAIGELADNTSRLVDALGRLNGNQLSALFNMGGVNLNNPSKESNGSTVENTKTQNNNKPVYNNNNYNSETLTNALITALKSSSFVFKFQGGPTQGILSLK